jgi:hypothetical protein
MRRSRSLSQSRRRQSSDDQGDGERDRSFEARSSIRSSWHQRAGHGAHHASNCRWAVPTLFLPAPCWWRAEDRPWSCIRGGTPRTLETTEVCAECPYWEPRTNEHQAVPVTAIEALHEALENTYRARATCQKAIEAFGSVQPFGNVRQDEERHARSLRALLGRLGVRAPQDTWPARVSAPVTLAEACAAAGRAELERQEMYERLIPFIDDPPVRRVMRRIQEASSRRYLPAFRRCFLRALTPTGRPRGVRGGPPHR